MIDMQSKEGADHRPLLDQRLEASVPPWHLNSQNIKEKSIRDAAAAELEKEKAVMAKEREMIAENARLAAKIEQLQEQISKLQK